MLASDLILWLLTALLEAFVVYLFVTQGFQKFLFLALYFLLSVSISVGRYAVLNHFGLSSPSYAYFYYITDALLTVSLFLGLLELGSSVVRGKAWRRRIVTWGATALLGTALFSFATVSSTSWRTGVRFAFELSRNMFVVSGLAVLALWVWVACNDPSDSIAAQFVSVLAVYFSLSFLFLIARELAPAAYASSLLYKMSSMVGVWPGVGCGFVLLSTSQLNER